jgi:hypothetical protein
LDRCHGLLYAKRGLFTIIQNSLDPISCFGSLGPTRWDFGWKRICQSGKSKRSCCVSIDSVGALLIVFAPKKFVETLSNARLVWIEECGHVPHLEQPDTTASAIAEFLKSDVETTATSVQQSQPTYLVGAGFVGALAVSQVLNLLASQ